jgi:hypothetical protein
MLELCYSRCNCDRGKASTLNDDVCDELVLVLGGKLAHARFPPH